jgi:hypothetical protein
MIGSVAPLDGRVDARSLSRVFSNHTRCAACRATYEIRLHYCPGCQEIRANHFHRECRCGAKWSERSAGHAPVDIQLGDPRFVPLCQNCGARHTDLSCMQPTCCQRPEVSYHDTRDPCALCRDQA